MRHEAAQCTLLPGGRSGTEDGRCVCPRGTRLIRGQCRKVSQGPTLEINPNLVDPKVLEQPVPRREPLTKQ